MEMLVTILVGLLGAGATVLAAYIQTGRQKEQHRAEEAKFALKHPSSSPSHSSQTATLEDQQVQVSLIFPGSSGLQDVDRRFKTTSVSYISIHLDGERIGSGNGASGFKVDFPTTVGMHDLVFSWEVDVTYPGNDTGTRTRNYRSEIELVFSRPGPCAVRLGYKESADDFYVRRFEPRGAGFVPLAAATARTMLIAGIVTILLSALVFWFLLKRS